MNNLIVRSISGIVYVALIVGAILAGKLWFTILVALFMLLAFFELEKLFDKSTETPQKPNNAVRLTDLIVGLAICISAPLCAFNQLYLRIFLLMLIGYPLVRLVLALYEQKQSPLESLARSLTKLFYVALPLGLLNVLYEYDSDAKWLVLAVFVMIWLNDTGAYCVGSLLGKHRLFERLSPKKSWEGFFGGLLFCLVAGYFASEIIDDQSSLTQAAWIGLGAVVSVFSTFGDLFESLLKRTMKVKDSGNLIPGHGGILDRIDSLLLVVPAVIFYVLVLNVPF